MAGEAKTITLVGIGSRGVSWLESVAQHPLWRIVALVDVSDKALEQARVVTGLEEQHCFSSLEDVFSSIPSDAVLLVVPIADHYPLIRMALAAGRHVLTEKPFVTEMAQARELVSMAESRHLALGITQNYRFEEPYETLRQAVQAGMIGRVLSVSIRFHRHRPVRPHCENEPAPFLFIQGIHFLDGLRALFGCEGESVQACSLNPPWSPYHNPPRWEALITMENGVLAHISGSFLGQGRQTPYPALWRVEGERGDLYLEEGPQGALELVHAWDGGREQHLPLVKVRPARDVLLDQFHVACSGGPEMPSSGRDNLGTLALVVALIAASRSGKSERVQGYLA